MRQRAQWRLAAILVAVGVAFSWSLGAQTPPKRPLTYDTFDYWRSISGQRLSNDGQWLAYSLTSQADDPELIVRNLKSGAEMKQPRGTGPLFTPDGKFLLFTIPAPKEEAGRGRAGARAGAPAAGAGAGAPGAGAAGAGATGDAAAQAARNSLGIMSLPDGKVTTVDQVATFRLPEESSVWLAYHKGRAGGGRNGGAGRAGGGRAGGGAAGGGRAGAGAAAAPPAAAGAAGETPAAEGAQTPATPEKKKDAGTDLVLHNLSTGQDTTIPEVSDFAWDKTGASLLYAVSSADGSKDGAFLRHLGDGSVTSLHTGKGNYKNLLFDDAGKQVAFLSDQAEYDKKISPYRLYYAKTGDPSAAELVSATTKGVPAGWVVSDNGAPRFSKDGLRLFLGTAPAPKPVDENAPAPIKVDLWSTRDELLQPMQQVRATQERNRNFRAMVTLADKRFTQLATLDLPTVNAGDDPVRLTGTSDLPYQKEISWDTTYNDVFLIDLKTGLRKKVLEHYNGSDSLSPGGSYMLYFDEPNGNWFTYRVADGTRTNLTERLPVKFFNQKHDTPDAPPALGSAGWTEGDKSVLLYDEYDIWEIHPDGTGARMVTSGDGRKQGLVYRYRPFDNDSAAGGGGRGGGAGGGERFIPANKPLVLATTNDETRATGYYKVNLTGTAAPEKITMMDAAMGTPMKAKDADVVVFTQSRFDQFPDLWMSDSTFRNPQKVTDANPQQSQFVWGKAEKISYRNADGKDLDAILIKPDNFDPAKKYPLMVYIYEGLSDTLHSYHAPNVGTSINLTRYVSNGYIVLEPDIVYGTGHPGQDAMKCVLPAISAVVNKGYVDPKRVAIQGHSWGGYQIAYMVTHTDVFAAVEAGAAVSNMISAYGGIRWGTGMVREFQYEKTQSRIGSTPWDDPLDFIENSPIFNVKNVHTPYLTIANDADDAVPWYQGIEFITALRRLGKEGYMFTYNGQPHGLRDRDDMKHWTVHMDEFFDHYLLGKARPEWMDKGVPFLEKGTRDVSGMFKRNTLPSPDPSVKKGGGY